MAILSTDLKFYKSAEVSSASTNGGVISTVEAVSGVQNNVWPHVLKAERDSGSTLYRKLFLKVDTDNDDVFIDPDLWNEAPTAGDDYIIMFAGTDSDTQASVNETKVYGAGTLQANASAGAGAISVTVENSAIAASIFEDGDEIRITDKSSPDSGVGTEERHVINGTPVVVGTTVTITLTGTLANPYVIGDKVQTIYSPGDVQSYGENFVVTTAGTGDYDETTYPLIGNNIGAKTETITLTFQDATNFTVVGSVSGTLDSGVSTSDYTPTDSEGNDMFTLSSAGFSGTWALSDTLVFETVAATIPFWLKRIVPAGASSLANNSNTTYVYGQAA